MDTQGSHNNLSVLQVLRIQRLHFPLLTTLVLKALLSLLFRGAAAQFSAIT